MDRGLPRFAARHQPPPLTTAATVAIGALMLLFLTALYEGGAFIHSLQHTPAQVWLLLAAMSFGATMLAYLWYFDGIRQLGVGTASAYMALVPVFGIAIATFWLHEPPHVSLLIGGAAVVAGMSLMNFAKRTKR